MNFPSAGFEAESILSRMHQALSQRIDQRCGELAVLFDRGTKQDLQAIFPILIDHIFGPQGTYSWNLRNTHAELHITEFTHIVNFLKPQGSLFKLIYALLQDPNIKYDFRLCYLPTKIHQMFESQNIHPFYSEIIQYTTHSAGKHPVSLLLNPFDYYIFHFAYYLINPCQQRLSNEDHWNSAYYNLCAEYFLHFFPTGENNAILPLIPFYHGKNPIQNIQSVNLRTHKQSSLLKANLFADQQMTDVKMLHQHLEKHPRNEIWRSETLLMAFMDFWLSNDQITQLNNLNVSLTTNYPELPSGDYIRIVRVAIKHLHAFTSTASIDTSPLGELRKHTMPMIQNRMYVFLKSLIYRWPLDESFRLILELWLSFIQPWRYSHDLYNQRGGIFKSSSTQVLPHQNDPRQADETYMQFIAENLLVYVVILQHLLPRFSRVDLASPRNAQMLFRLTKVFNQPNLVPMLKAIESLVDFNANVQNTLNCSNILPPLSFAANSKPNNNTSTQLFSSTQINLDSSRSNFENNDTSTLLNVSTIERKYLNSVRQKIFELEGVNFKYRPLFTARPAPEIYVLLNLVKSSEMKAIAYLNESKQRRQQQHSGFWAFLTQTFAEDPDEINIGDRHKAPMFLKYSAENLMEIFTVTDFDNFDVTMERVSTSESESGKSNYSQNNFTNMLAPTKVKERLKTVKYEGDPDLMPIQSYEIAFLVRLFYTLCKNINDKYAWTIYNLYHSTGMIGTIASHFLQEPTQVYKYEKKNGFSKRQMYSLPPRLSLRPLAKRSFIYFLCIGTMFSYFVLKLGIFAFSILYFMGYMVKIFFRSIFSPKQRTNTYRNVLNSDLSLNDSLDE